MKRNKIQKTEKQAKQFNDMLRTLRKISQAYQTPSKLRRSSEKDYGLDYEECLEMAYENIQGEAAYAAKGVKLIPIPTHTTAKEGGE